VVEKSTGGLSKRYTGDQIDVTYNVRRCIHAQECVKRLPAVFDRESRPWVRADAASPDQIAEVILACPSGALHFERKDDGIEEAASSEASILLWENGPLQIQGDLSISGTEIEMEETRVTLCRCGESTNKPFCDNSHLKTGFHSEDMYQSTIQELEGESSRLAIDLEPNGPYVVSGSVHIYNHAGDLLFAGDRVKLCRCGYSHTRPFCDGTHLTNQFQAE